MSAPGDKVLKRPKGLLNSRKRASEDHEPKEKRIKLQDTSPTNEEGKPPLAHQESRDVNEEDWEDLVELFENASNAYESTERGTSAPLLRGVLHECDRFIRHAYEPHKATRCSPVAFCTIHGSALYLLGAVISEDPSVISTGEPFDPCDYFEAAQSALAHGKAHLSGVEWVSDPWAVKLQSTLWLVHLAMLEIKIENSINREGTTSPAFSLVDNYSQGLTDDFSPIKTNGLPSISLGNDDFPSRAKSILDVMNAYISVVEKTFHSDVQSVESLMIWVEDFLQSLDSTGSNTAEATGFISIRAKMLLIKGSSWAERYERTFSERDEGDLKDESAVEARAHLKQAIRNFELAMKFPDRWSEEDFEQLSERLGNDAGHYKSWLAEALVTLAGLTEDGIEQADLFSRAKVLGVDVDAEDSEEESEHGSEN